MALIANAGASGTTGTVTTGAIDTTGAGSLFVHVGNYSGSSQVRLSDNKGNIWIRRTAYFPSGVTVRSQLFHCVNSPIVGTGHTFTAATNGGATFPAICVAAFSDTIVWFNEESGATGTTGTSVSPGSVAPQGSSALFVTGISWDQSRTMAIDDGFTITNQVNWASGNNFGSGLAYKYGTAAENPSWSWTTNTPHATGLIVGETTSTPLAEPTTSQVHVFGSGGFSTSAAGNFFLAGRLAGTSQTRHTPLAVAVTLRGWTLDLTTAPGAGKSRLYVLQKNGVDTPLSITIQDTVTSGRAVVEQGVHFAAGDLAGILIVDFNSPTASGTTRSAFEIVPDTPGQYLTGWGTSSSANTELCPFGSTEQGWAGAAAFTSRSLIDLDGTITHLACREATAPGGANARTYVIYKNGVIQDGTAGSVDTRCTITGAAVQTLALFSLPVVAGDNIGLRYVPTGSPAGSLWQTGSMVFTPTDPLAVMYCTTLSGLTDPGPQFGGISHAGENGTWSSPEATFHLYGQERKSVFLNRIRVELSGAPGAGKTRTFVLRKNGANTALTVTVADAATAAVFTVSPAVEITDADLWNLQATSSGTPGAGSARVVVSGGFAEAIVETLTATNIRSTSATLRGRIDPNGTADFDGRFVWWVCAESPPTETETDPVSIGFGSEPIVYTTTITGLLPSTTYCYRAIGDNGTTDIFGEIKSFTTTGEAEFIDGTVSHPLTWLEMYVDDGDLL